MKPTMCMVKTRRRNDLLTKSSLVRTVWSYGPAKLTKTPIQTNPVTILIMAGVPLRGIFLFFRVGGRLAASTLAGTSNMEQSSQLRNSIKSKAGPVIRLGKKKT